MSNVTTNTGFKDSAASAWQGFWGTNQGTSFMGHTYMINEMIEDPKTLAEKVLKSGATAASITVPVPSWQNETMTWKTTTIPFFLEKDFAMSLSNKWNATLDLELANTLTKLSNAVGMFQGGTAQVTNQSRAMNSKTWGGSEFGGFDVDCLFICTRRTINPVEIIKILAKTCLPATLKDYKGVPSSVFQGTKTMMQGAVTSVGNMVNGALSFIGNNFSSASSFVQNSKNAVSNTAEAMNAFIDDMGMVAPLNYGLVFDQDAINRVSVHPTPGTTVALHIGEWFHAQELVVASMSNVQFSKELIAPPAYYGKNAKDLYNPVNENENYGFPLYARCSLKLEPYTLVDLKTFDEYFVQQDLKTYLSGSGINTPSYTTTYELPTSRG